MSGALQSDAWQAHAAHAERVRRSMTPQRQQSPAQHWSEARGAKPLQPTPARPPASDVRLMSPFDDDAAPLPPSAGRGASASRLENALLQPMTLFPDSRGTTGLSASMLRHAHAAASAPPARPPAFNDSDEEVDGFSCVSRDELPTPVYIPRDLRLCGDSDGMAFILGDGSTSAGSYDDDVEDDDDDGQVYASPDILLLNPAPPAKNAEPANKAAPSKKAAPAKKATPAKKAVPARKAAPAKKAVPAKKSAAVKKSAVVKKAAPVKTAPVSKAPPAKKPAANNAGKANSKTSIKKEVVGKAGKKSTTGLKKPAAGSKAKRKK
jgi:hypothetical protein